HEYLIALPEGEAERGGMRGGKDGRAAREAVRSHRVGVDRVGRLLGDDEHSPVGTEGNLRRAGRAATQRPGRTGKGLEAPVFEKEPGDVVRVSDGAPRVEAVEAPPVPGAAQGPAPPSRGVARAPPPPRLEGEGGPGAASRVHAEEPALVLGEHAAALVAGPLPRAEPAGRERPCA